MFDHLILKYLAREGGRKLCDLPRLEDCLFLSLPVVPGVPLETCLGPDLLVIMVKLQRRLVGQGEITLGLCGVFYFTPLLVFLPSVWKLFCPESFILQEREEPHTLEGVGNEEPREICRLLFSGKSEH